MPFIASSVPMHRISRIMIYAYILWSSLLIVGAVQGTKHLSPHARSAATRQPSDSFCNPTKPNKLNVHIISHTHLDAGWVKTYDEYYRQSVYDIISTVTESLLDQNGKESRKFTFVEMAFFSRFWNDIPTKKRNQIKGLVSSGKLHFTSGGWVMNDEATPHYLMIIDQMSLGIRWINDTFGQQYLPTIGWQIDPFGHSREFASILSQIGFNAVYQGRIDYQDKEKRMKDRNMEFIWKTDPNLKNFLFTGITPAGYYPSKGVCLNCYHETNGKNLIKQVKSQITGYRTNHLMETMGGDFNYVFAESSFKSLDQLIDYVNSIQNEIFLLYSTPDCYTKAVHQSAVNWTHYKTDDFFPYADRFNDFWSGYFTSRPAFKYLINYGHSILQICKQLIPKANIHPKGVSLIKHLEEAIGIGLHHDAITGTAKQYVVDNYVAMISQALAASERLITIAYKKLYGSDAEPHFCHKLNVSECHFLEKTNGSPVEIAIYNPLVHRVSDNMRLPLIDANYQLSDANGKAIQSQIIPIPNFIRSLPERSSSAKYELVFETDLEAFSFTKYYLQPILTQYIPRLTTTPYKSPIDLIISNTKLSLIIDGTTGLLKAIRRGDDMIGLSQNFGFYTRGVGKNSGAYAMHTSDAGLTLVSHTASIFVTRGDVCQEVIQEFTPFLKQIIRLYKNNDFVEFEWTAGPLPEDKDYELVSRFNTGFRSDQTFYTDSNGKQTIERKRNHRQTWQLSTSEMVASNYYPVVGWLFIRDILADLQLTLVPDRPEGGSSIEDGSVELMIHRRLHFDDGYGMEEELNEPGVDGRGLVVRGKHYLLVDRIGQSMRKVKDLNLKLFWKALSLFSKTTKESKQAVTQRAIGVVDNIDPSLHLLTLEELEQNLLLVRLEFFSEPLDSNVVEISVVLNRLFTGIEIISVTETTLTGAETLADMESRKFKWICSECDQKSSQRSVYSSQQKISLARSQIRSFILKVKRI